MTSVISIPWELSHRSRSTAVLRCVEVCARIDIAKTKMSKKMEKKMMRCMGERIETVDLRHCKVKKMKSVKFEKEKKIRDIIKVYKIMSEPEDLTHLSIYFPLTHIFWSPFCSSSFQIFQNVFALFSTSLSPLIYEPLHIIFHPSSFLYTSSYDSDNNINTKSKYFLNINKCITLKNENIIVHRTKK